MANELHFPLFHGYVDRWLVSGVTETPVITKPTALHGAENEKLNTAPKDKPGEEQFKAERRAKATAWPAQLDTRPGGLVGGADNVTPFTVYWPFDDIGVTYAWDCETPACLSAWAYTELDAAEAGSVPFDLITCGGAALYRKSILDEIGVFDENFFAYFEDVDLSWRANNAGYKNVLCPTAKCYHICGASTGAVRYNAFKSQQSGRNSILLPLKNEPLLMLILNILPLALGYLLKCYKFHKQGFGEAWDKGMHEAFALLKSGRLGKRPFRLKDLPNYILMELWMIWNMVPYLWYRLVIVKFDLK